MVIWYWYPVYFSRWFRNLLFIIAPTWICTFLFLQTWSHRVDAITWSPPAVDRALWIVVILKFAPSKLVSDICILVSEVSREQGVSPVFSVCNNFEGRKGSCCVVCCCSFLSSIHPATVLYFRTGTYGNNLVCHAMILSSTIHQYVNSHLHCSQTITVLLIQVSGK
jgi:hypothetical protein